MGDDEGGETTPPAAALRTKVPAVHPASWAKLDALKTFSASEWSGRLGLIYMYAAVYDATATHKR